MGTLDYKRPSTSNQSAYPPLAPWISRMWMINSVLLLAWPVGVWLIDHAYRCERMVVGWIDVVLVSLFAGILATLILTGASGILWLGTAIDLRLSAIRLTRRDWIGFGCYGVIVVTYVSLIVVGAMAR